MKSEALMILCLSLLAASQTALGRPPAAGEGASEDGLSGTWLVTVHFTTSKPGVFGFSQTETHDDYKGAITFVPTATEHYAASGHVNFSPQSDEERIYNVYFQSCARREGHDIAKASPYTYNCTYEYGEANRYSDGTTTTTVYKGDLTFELNSRTLSGSTG